MMQSSDAIVIGGGPAGATTALLLARAGWSVALIEQATFPRRKVCGEYLSAANLPLLHRLGVARAFEEWAGPEVQRVGLFAGRDALAADMPAPGNAHGRALGREHLDALLLDRAAAEGAKIWQPWSANTLVKERQGYLCRAFDTRRSLDCVRVVVAAHGSWLPGALATQARAPRPKGRSFGFKHASRSAGCPMADAPAGLPRRLWRDGCTPITGSGLVLHPARIGSSASGRRRMAAGACWRTSPVNRRDTAVTDCAHENLATAAIQPGIRSCGANGLFLVNAARSPPVVAEDRHGVQSLLLCGRLMAGDGCALSRREERAALHCLAEAVRAKSMQLRDRSGR